MQRLGRALGTAVVAALVLCPMLTFGGAPQANSKPVASAGAVPASVSLRIAMPDSSPTVDPALVADEENAELANLLYVGLVRLDDHYRVVPSAAARWSISRDRRTYTFYLRRGLRFSNGDAITASDFEYSIRRSLSPALKSPSAPTYLLDVVGAPAYLAGKATSVSGIKVQNASTLQITVRWPVPYFLMELTYPTSFVLDKKRISKLGSITNTSWYTNPITSGPFRLKSWSPNAQMVLVPNKYFAPAPAVKKIVVSLSPLPSSDLYSFVTHNLDVTTLPSDQRGLLRYQGVHETSMLAVDGLYMNLKSKPLGSVGVRRALTMSLNRPALVTSAMGPAATPFLGAVPPGEWGYDSALRPLPYDASSARKSLGAAGYADAKKFPTLTLYYAQDPYQAKLAQAIAKAWRSRLKIKVSTSGLTLNTLLAKVQAGALPLYLLGWSADYPDPHDWLSLQWETGALNNNVHFHDSAFDRLVRTADVTPDPTQRLRLYHQAQQVLVDDAAWIPLYVPHRLDYVRPSITNLTVTGYGLIPRDGSWAEVNVAPVKTKGHRAT